MGQVTRRARLRGTMALLAAGCGFRAVRLPTPAANLDRASLNQAAPGERFYVIVFASQSVPRRPAASHTWATVIRRRDDFFQRDKVEANRC
jgi:hypothetical protein